MARKQNRRKASPAAAILTVLVLAALFVWRMLGSPEDGKTQITLPNGELHVWFLDVGQADSSLLVCDGQAMLIDGGNVDDASYVVASLEQYGVTSLDYVINTHCDEDHVGGLVGVLAKFPAEHVWSSTAEYGTKAFSNFVKYANEQGRAIEIPSPGNTFTLGEAEITVLGRCRYNELPFEINHSREADESQRLKYRYLDLRNPEVKANIILRCNVVSALRTAMTEHGFLEITTPILTASSPEGARDYLVPASSTPCRRRRSNLSSSS